MPTTPANITAITRVMLHLERQWSADPRNPALQAPAVLVHKLYRTMVGEVYPA